MTIYIVLHNDRGDVEIVGVFDTLEKATATMAAYAENASIVVRTVQ